MLTVAVGLRRAPDPDLIGTARRAYTTNGSLRLHGLFTEPVVTASGYAGRSRTPSHRTAGSLAVRRGAGRRRPCSTGRGLRGPRQRPHPAGTGRPRRGDPHHPTVSPDGRIGGGGAVRSVRASGPVGTRAARHALAAFPADQVAAALRWSAEPADERDAGGDLLFLTGTITGGGFAVDGGPTVRLLAPDERPELPYVENLQLLAGAHGLSLRLVARLATDRPSGVRALAAAWQGTDGDPVRADLGLRRLNRTHLPRTATAVIPSTPAPALPRNSTSCGGPWTARSRVAEPSPPPWPTAHSPSARRGGSDHRRRVRACAGGHRVGPAP
ncbi:hypothetical protein O1M63_52785 [Streptomyces mirabilis]|nr:hypothetical protein [Streptomyces mirabilis]